MTPVKRHEFSFITEGFSIGFGIYWHDKVAYINLGLVSYSFHWDIIDSKETHDKRN